MHLGIEATIKPLARSHLLKNSRCRTIIKISLFYCVVQPTLLSHSYMLRCVDTLTSKKPRQRAVSSDTIPFAGGGDGCFVLFLIRVR